MSSGPFSLWGEGPVDCGDNVPAPVSTPVPEPVPQPEPPSEPTPSPTDDDGAAVATDTPPGVRATTPTDGATGVSPRGPLVVFFDEPVEVSRASFDLRCNGIAEPLTVVGAPGERILLVPESSLAPGVGCTLTVNAAAVRDVDRIDPPDQPEEDTVVSFTTDAAPRILSSAPTDGERGVDPGARVSVVFSEPVTVADDAVRLSCAGDDVQVDAVVRADGTAELTPTEPLPRRTVCTVTVLADGVSDVDAADPPDHPADDYRAVFRVR
jgi:hypothetical protein